jgi:cytidylate kinase
MIIAVDGPAASGKGTIAKALASHFGLPHLDTGLLYRAVALNLLQMDGDPESEFSAARACDIAQIDFSRSRAEVRGGRRDRVAHFRLSDGARASARAPAPVRRPGRRAPCWTAATSAR